MRFWLVLVCGCGFDRQGAPDLSAVDLSGMAPADLAGADLRGSATNCRTLPLPCLAAGPGIVDVASAGDVQGAFSTAQIGDTIQIRGLSLGAGFRVPSGVTLHGCMGAQITDSIAFEGGTGTIEGFVVPGAIIPNRTGSYVIRANRFVEGGSTAYGGVSARANEGIVSATVTVLVEGNWFSLRDIGVEGITAYDTMTHTLNLTIRNNVFYGNTAGVTLIESGIVGQINAQIDFNTFVLCPHGVELSNVTPTIKLTGDIFYLGSFAVVSDSPYEINYVYTHGAQATMGVAPQSGTFVSRDPMFADWAASDLHLLPGSELVDVVPAGAGVPSQDYFGCARPVGNGAEVGAIENQQ